MSPKPKNIETYPAQTWTRHNPAWPVKMWHIVREDILSQRVNDTIDGAAIRCENVLDTVKNRYPNTIDKVKRNVTPILSSLNEKKEAVTRAYQNHSKARVKSKSKPA